VKTQVIDKARKNPESMDVNVDIEVNDDKIVMDFNKSITWLEIEPVVAIRMAETLKEKAIEILRSEPR
jgi:hypothetical protein